jgi:3',5'-cyclic AMP phosphodiesterase CpdA
VRAFAHISDLHIGRDARTDEAAARVCRALLEEGIDDVLVTGDVTHRGRGEELFAFRRIFAPLQDRMVVVPGNHDRLGDDVAAALMPGPRVQAEFLPGLLVVRLDSTAPHNRKLIQSHGELTPRDIDAIEQAVAAAPPRTLVALMLHHHLLPLPEDGIGERIASFLGWPNAAELELGEELIARLRGRCDLVLHGHRHATSELALLPRSGRTLHVMNAGCTPEQGRARVVTHEAGRLLAQRWLDLDGPRAAPAPRTAPRASAMPAAA